MSIWLVAYVIAGAVWAVLSAAVLPFLLEPKTEYRDKEAFGYGAVIAVFSAVMWPVFLCFAVAAIAVYVVSAKLRGLGRRFVQALQSVGGG